MDSDDPSAALLAGLEQSTLLVALFDPQDRLRVANSAYRAAFLRGAELPITFVDVLRLGFRGGFGVKIDSGDVERFVADIVPRRRSASHRAFHTDTVDGRWLNFTETLLDSGWLLTVATEITALKQHERLMAQAHAVVLHASQTDPLTGVSNRRHALELAGDALARCANGGGTLSVVMLDIDFFKQINDRHGHHVGDEVLRRFCAECKSHLRPSDSIGRIGGEEFMLLLPGSSKEVARTIVGRLRASISASIESRPDANPFRYTFSAGVAEPGAGEGLDALMQRADAALYQAKRGGRDRCVVA